MGVAYSPRAWGWGWEGLPWWCVRGSHLMPQSLRCLDMVIWVCRPASGKYWSAPEEVADPASGWVFLATPSTEGPLGPRLWSKPRSFLTLHIAQPWCSPSWSHMHSRLAPSSVVTEDKYVRFSAHFPCSAATCIRRRRYGTFLSLQSCVGQCRLRPSQLKKGSLRTR